MDGVEFTWTGFCVGDNVTFTCTLPLIAHQWNGPGFDRVLLATSTSVMGGPDDQFTLAVVNYSALGIVTSLSVLVYSGLNGASFNCSDGGLLSTNMQTATATVLGKI